MADDPEMSKRVLGSGVVGNGWSHRGWIGIIQIIRSRFVRTSVYYIPAVTYCKLHTYEVLHIVITSVMFAKGRAASALISVGVHCTLVVNRAEKISDDLIQF
jgi:hypothetical protein